MPLHDASTQTVPEGCRAHAPAPSHTPVEPHVAAGCVGPPSSGSVPAATGPHAPSAPDAFFAALHAMHVELHASAQQKPSMQKPEAHWGPTAQDDPVAAGAAVTATPRLGMPFVTMR